ncbi:prolipoprotein diacylglyceryl transferase [Silvibacterium bohemicum]|uniref:prolipoprotein diacylglyceryl transferase n=1 Tax=Silvibacterium bohemicum TaxID=1577686 RepID=UPI0012E2AD20|nr:prolipoprotein diacylglyceryl transferase [Silvibacterium bohemicum]
MPAKPSIKDTIFFSIQRHYWVDNLNPWIVHFYGGFGIRWYGASYVAGFLIAAWMFSRWARRGRLPLSADQVPTLMLYLSAGVIVGGRVGYCIFYDLHDVMHDPLEVFAVWHGGMASHGGILGLVLALWLFATRFRIDPLRLLDAAAAVGPLGIALGRIANFINGELWGRPTTVVWAVIFPEAPLIGGVNVPRHPSQIYAALIEGLMVFFIAQWTYAKTKRPGLTTAAVCVAYGVGRFIDEFWREPDLGQPVYWGWMSKGQLLTIPMIAFGIILFIRQFKHGAVPKG